MGHYTTYRHRGSVAPEPQRVEVYAGPAAGSSGALITASVWGFASRFVSGVSALITEVDIKLYNVLHTGTTFYAGIHLDSAGLPGALVGAEVGINNDTLPTGTHTATWTGLSSRVSSGQVLWVSFRINSYPGSFPGEPLYGAADSEIVQLSSGGVWSLYAETAALNAQVWGLVG
jgi:hypothetical protein